ncbi:MAG: hypothetical protein ACREJ2_02885 [Planctomycetota bacterium]
MLSMPSPKPFPCWATALFWCLLVVGPHASTADAKPEAGGSVRLPAPIFVLAPPPGAPPGAKSAAPSPAKVVPPPLGGPDHATILLQPDREMLAALLLHPADLQEASLTLTLAPAGDEKSTAAAQLEVLELLRASPPGQPVNRQDCAAQPVASVALDALEKNRRQTIHIDGLAPLLTRWLAHPQESQALVLAVQATAAAGANPGPLPRLTLVAGSLEGQVVIRHEPSHELFENPLHPQDGVFAQMKDGHLYYGGRRLRLWGTAGWPNPRRLLEMGFNAERIWHPDANAMYDAASAARGEVKPYVKGDNSAWDQADRHVAEAEKAGLFMMLAATTGTLPAAPLSADDSFLAGGPDWLAWRAAMRSPHPDDMHWLYVDPRLQRARKRFLKNLLTHVNPYTGRAYGQEPAIVIYELFNENGGAKHLLEGSFEKWPGFFRDELQQRWNAWLTARYHTDAALLQAWGKLDPGESLQGSSVRPGPTLETHGKMPAARGDDFVRFVIELVDGYDQDLRSYCRTLAPAGVGVNVAPFSFDTQYMPNLAWSYLQSRCEVNCPGMYFWDLKSSLTRPPAAYVLDGCTVAGSATVVYETNQGRPDPYRAEYPLKLAALAGWQDWDGVFWHYWARGGEGVDEAYLTHILLPPGPGNNYWDAVQDEVDPVMCSSLAAAGRIFLNHRIAAAPHPEIVTVGANALFGYRHYNGVNQATFTQGSRMNFVADRPGDVTVNGAPPPAPPRIAGAVASGDEILWDWPNGRLIIDTPTAKVYVGNFTGPYRFKDGIVLGDVGTPFVSFAMVSADDKPLAGPDATHRIYLTAVFDARNTGFDMDWSVKGGPTEQAKAIRNVGTLPVRVDPVPYSVWFPTAIRGRFEGYDFALRQAVDQSLDDTNRVDHAGRTLFMSVLEVATRGRPLPTPQPQTMAQAGGGTSTPPSDVPAADATATATVATGTGWTPLPGLGWHASYAAAYRLVHQSTLKYASLTPADAGPGEDKTLVVTGLQLADLWGAEADLELDFHAGGLTAITVTFKTPPPFADAVADTTTRFGAPTEKHFGAQFESSLARWPAAGTRPAVTMTESQGIFKILYTAP